MLNRLRHAGIHLGQLPLHGLEVTPQKLLEVVERYFVPESSKPGLAVIAGEDQLQKANTQLSGKALKMSAI